MCRGLAHTISDAEARLGCVLNYSRDTADTLMVAFSGVCY